MALYFSVDRVAIYQRPHQSEQLPRYTALQVDLLCKARFPGENPKWRYFLQKRDSWVFTFMYVLSTPHNHSSLLRKDDSNISERIWWYTPDFELVDDTGILSGSLFQNINVGGQWCSEYLLRAAESVLTQRSLEETILWAFLHYQRESRHILFLQSWRA